MIKILFMGKNTEDYFIVSYGEILRPRIKHCPELSRLAYIKNEEAKSG